jgi:hypothetical protein
MLTIKIYLPTLSIALEYQGETHFYSSHVFGRASDRQKADELKRQFAAKVGITLIPIPFWWDKLPASLASTLQLYRPDLGIQAKSAIVPLDMPQKFIKLAKYVPNSAAEYKEQVDPKGW